MLGYKVEYYSHYSKKREEGVILDKFLNYTRISEDASLAHNKYAKKIIICIDFYKIQKSDKTLENIPCSDIAKIL